MSFKQFIGSSFRSERFTLGILISKALKELFPKAAVNTVEISDIDVSCSVSLPHALDAEAVRLIEERVRQSIKASFAVQPIEMVAENAAAMLRDHGQSDLARRLRTFKGQLVTLVRLEDYFELAPLDLVDCTDQVGEIKLLEAKLCSNSGKSENGWQNYQVTAVAFPDRKVLKDFLKSTQLARKNAPEQILAEMGWVQPIGAGDGKKYWIWAGEGAEFIESIRNWAVSTLSETTCSIPSSMAKSCLDNLWVNGPSSSSLWTRAAAHQMFLQSSSKQATAEWGQLELEAGESLLQSPNYHEYELTFQVPRDTLISSVTSLLQLLSKISKLLGFESEFTIDSRRLDCRIPRKEWAQLEQGLAQAFKEMSLRNIEPDTMWPVPPLGPEVKVVWKDELGRSWEGSRLTLVAKACSPKQVTLSTSLFGPVERMLALLMWSSTARIPMPWLPLHVRLEVLDPEKESAATELERDLAELGLNLESSSPDQRSNRKFRSAENERIPYTVGLGSKGCSIDQVKVLRFGEDLGFMSRAEFVSMIQDEWQKQNAQLEEVGILMKETVEQPRKLKH